MPEPAAAHRFGTRAIHAGQSPDPTTGIGKWNDEAIVNRLGSLKLLPFARNDERRLKSRLIGRP